MSWDDDDFDVDKVVAPVASSDATKKSWDEPEESWESIAAREAREAAEKAASVPKNPNAGKPKEPKKKADAPAEKERELTPEEALLESRKREQLVKEADFKNALDLFGVDNAPKKSEPATGDLLTMNPKTEADFTKFAELISVRTSEFSGSAHYKHMVKEISKHLSEPLSVDDLRDVIKVLNNSLNDKIKSAKGGKSKAPKKAAVKLNVKGGASDDKFEDHITDKYDDYADDFM